MAENTVNTPAVAATETAPAETTPTTRDEARYVKPQVDIHETDEGLVVVADLPGVQHDGIDINVENDVLTIEAHARKDTQRPGRAGEGGYREFQLLNFYRQFQLGDKVDREKINADFKHGVLTLRLPKAEQAKPRRIQVSVA